jgi:hypothetical protein
MNTGAPKKSRYLRGPRWSCRLLRQAKITDLSLNQSFSVFVNKLATNPI